MTDIREAIDRQGDVPLENALAQLLADGDLRRHAAKARRIYAERRDALAAELTAKLPTQLSFSLPAGGLAIWAWAESGIDAETWATEAARRGLNVSAGVRFAFEPSRAESAFRIGFAHLDESEMQRAVGILVRSAPTRGSESSPHG
jgi:GntR family transcriptional regulator / MocR family aminotransferase